MKMQPQYGTIARRGLASRLLRTSLLTAATAVMLLGTISTVGAQNHVNTSRGFTAAGAPLAVHGYDVVAYFTEGRPRLGKAAFSVTHDGAAYQFATQANKEAFERNPERYVPQFGGFCAYGAAVGAKFDGDPNVWKIVNGKLYLNLNPDIQKTWAKDIPGNIAKAEQNWTRIRDKAPSELK